MGTNSETETHNWKMFRERETLEHSVLDGLYSTNPPPTSNQCSGDSAEDERGFCRKAVRVSDDGGLQGKVSTRLNLTDKHMNSEAVVAYPGPKQVQVTVSVVFLSFFWVLYCFI